MTSATATATDRWLSRQLSAPKQNYPRIVARVREEPELVEALLESLCSKTAKVKFGSAKALWLLSEAAPELLYSRFDVFVSLLDGENRILSWNAARVLACLAPVDGSGKVDAILDKYLGSIRGPDMIAASNAIQYASRIAFAKPELADKIAGAILSVRTAKYKTDECRNVAIGHAIASLDRFLHLVTNRTAVIGFVAGQLANRRPAVRKKAEAFLKKHGPL